MIEHTSQRVFCITALGRVLYGFTDGNAQAAWGVRVLRQDRATSLCICTRTGDYLRSPGLHHHPAVGFLIVRDLDHVDLALQPKERAGHGESRPPLPGASLSGEPGHPF